MRDFRKLEIWQQSLGFAKKIYSTTENFPSHEKYGITSQMNRSAVSIPSNIAEGCSRKTASEFLRVLEISLGSAFELETQIEICLQINYINQKEYTSLIEELHILQKRINFLRSRI